MADFVAARGSATILDKTLPVPVTGTCVAGNTLVAVFGANGPFQTISVSDTQSNIWQLSALSNGNQHGVAFFSCRITTPLTASDTVTAVGTANFSTLNGILGEFTGLVAPADTEAPNDVVFTATGAASPWSIGPSPSTTFASEIAVSAFSTNFSPTFTAGTGYTLVDSTIAASSGVRTGMQYRLLTAVGQQTATATFSVDGHNWTGVLVTFITDTPVNAPPPLIG